MIAYIETLKGTSRNADATLPYLRHSDVERLPFTAGLQQWEHKVDDFKTECWHWASCADQFASSAPSATSSSL
eukprot:708889-Amphidinium_carterae.2